MYYRGKHHRISPIELLVLRILKEKPLYGNEIINELKKEFGDTSFEAKSGTIYPILKKFLKRNWIQEESGDEYKRKYRLTDEGEKKLENIVDDDMIDGFERFHHKFSNFFFFDFPRQTTDMKKIYFLKREIKRLERRKKYLEEQLSKISNAIENKKERIKEIEKDSKFVNIPIE